MKNADRVHGADEPFAFNAETEALAQAAGSPHHHCTDLPAGVCDLLLDDQPEPLPSLRGRSEGAALHVCDSLCHGPRLSVLFPRLLCKALPWGGRQTEEAAVSFFRVDISVVARVRAGRCRTSIASRPTRAPTNCHRIRCYAHEKQQQARKGGGRCVLI